MRRPCQLVLVLVLVHLAAIGCHAEIGGTGCAPAQTTAARMIQDTVREAVDQCWQAPTPQPSPLSFTGDGGTSGCAFGEDPCSACVLACGVSDLCVGRPAGEDTIMCVRISCSEDCS